MLTLFDFEIDPVECEVLWLEVVELNVLKKNSFNEATIDIDSQATFVREIAAAVGFDFDRGRLDRSVHPFCGGSHCNDVRLTTRFQPTEFNDALGSTMHEAGHGLYEQGLPFSMVGLPLGEAISLGIHESQSRMWENQVGRSEAEGERGLCGGALFEQRLCDAQNPESAGGTGHTGVVTPRPSSQRTIG